jgi:hypothetical protein
MAAQGAERSERDKGIAGLKVPSSVRFDKIATIDKNIIAGRIGNA